MSVIIPTLYQDILKVPLSLLLFPCSQRMKEEVLLQPNVIKRIGGAHAHQSSKILNLTSHLALAYRKNFIVQHNSNKNSITMAVVLIMMMNLALKRLKYETKSFVNNSCKFYDKSIIVQWHEGYFSRLDWYDTRIK